MTNAKYDFTYLVLTANYDKILEILTTELEDFAFVEDISKKPKVHNEISEVFLTIGNIQEAKKYAQEAFKNAILLNNQEELFRAYINLTECSIELGSHSDAELSINKLESQLGTITDELLQTRFYLTNARYKIMIKKFAEAQNDLNMADAFSKKIKINNARKTELTLRIKFEMLQLLYDLDSAHPLEILEQINSYLATIEKENFLEYLWRFKYLKSLVLLRLGKTSDAEKEKTAASEIVHKISNKLPKLQAVFYLNSRLQKALLSRGGEKEENVIPGSCLAETSNVSNTLSIETSTFKRIIEIIKLFNSEMNLPKLFKLIVDSMIEMCNANCGYILIL